MSNPEKDLLDALRQARYDELIYDLEIEFPNLVKGQNNDRHRTDPSTDRTNQD